MRRRKGGATEDPQPKRQACDKDFATVLWISAATYDFSSQHTKEAALLSLWYNTCMLPLTCMTYGIHMRFNGMSSIPFAAFPMFAWLCGTVFLRRRLKEALKTWPLALGTIVQVVHHVMHVWHSVDMAMSLPAELIQHRTFCIGFSGLYVVASMVLFVPPAVFAILVCPVYLCGWCAFHSMTDFVRVPAILNGVIIVGLGVYGHYGHAGSLKHTFDLVQDLVKERQLLQTTQESLHGILGSIFDASCVCDRHGQLLECSPHMQERFQGLCEGNRIEVGLNLCSFAATSQESERLQSFLLNAYRTAPKLSIECSIECNTTSSHHPMLIHKLSAFGGTSGNISVCDCAAKKIA